MRKKQPKIIGSAVRSYRALLGMTQSEVAELADVTPETLSRIERNKIAASLDLTRRLATSLQVTIDALIDPVKQPMKRGLRPSEARLLNVVRDLDDAQVDELTRAVKTLMSLGRARAPSKSKPA